MGTLGFTYLIVEDPISESCKPAMDAQDIPIRVRTMTRIKSNQIKSSARGIGKRVDSFDCKSIFFSFFHGGNNTIQLAKAAASLDSGIVNLNFLSQHSPMTSEFHFHMHGGDWRERERKNYLLKIN